MKKICILVVLGLSACIADTSSTQTTQTTDADDARTPLGKADNIGMCTEDTCGGRSDDQCWCDDLCTRFGDCCDNYEEICTDACDGDTEPVSLEPVDTDTSALVDTYNTGCANGFENCVMQSIDVFALPECVEQPVDFVTVVDILTGSQGAVFDQGDVVDRDGLVAFFDTSDNSEAMVADLVATVGADIVQAWVILAEIPCHNCTQFSDFAVVLFDDGTVVQLIGEHGFDS